MRDSLFVKLTFLMLAVLLIGGGCIPVASASSDAPASSDAAASSPAQAMSAHLWINGLPDGQLVAVTVAGHVQLNYYGGQGRYDFPVTGQPGEIIRVLAGDREVQSFSFEPGAPVYLGFTYADGVVTSSPYDSSVPVPTPYPLSTIAPEPQTEHTGLGLDGSWIFVMATMMSFIVVGCFATVRRKGR